MQVTQVQDYSDGSSSLEPLHAKTISKSLYLLPAHEEIQACWELGRFHNNIGFWVVWLPTGTHVPL